MSRQECDPCEIVTSFAALLFLRTLAHPPRLSAGKCRGSHRAAELLITEGTFFNSRMNVTLHMAGMSIVTELITLSANADADDENS